MANLAVLLVGHCQRQEMSPVRDWVSSLGSHVIVRQTDHLPENAQLEPPDFVIVCQSWPDEFSASEVSEALGRWPLALWVCCYGAWCDSDGRTRSIWPISVRVPVREALSRLDHLWQIINRTDGEPLPITASRDEAFEFDHCNTALSGRKP